MDVWSIDLRGFRRKTSRVPKLSTEDRKRVGQLLRARREGQTPKLRQQDVAAKLGCVTGTVQNIERNRHDVDRDTIEQYAALFGTTIERLLHPEPTAIAPSDPRFVDLHPEHLEIARGYMRGARVVRAAVEALVAADPLAEELAKLMLALQRDTELAYWMTMLLEHGELATALARRLQSDQAFRDRLASLLDDEFPKGKK
jgi:transcriptional regulator with XRE-family HTH domain